MNSGFRQWVVYMVSVESGDEEEQRGWKQQFLLLLVAIIYLQNFHKSDDDNVIINRLFTTPKIYDVEGFRYIWPMYFVAFRGNFMKINKLYCQVGTRSSATAEKQRVSCACLPIRWLTDRARHRTPQNRRGCTVSDTPTHWFKKCWPKTHFDMK